MDIYRPPVEFMPPPIGTTMTTSPTCPALPVRRRAQFRLPRTTTAPRSARRLIDTVLDAWHTPGDVADTLRLLAVELITNAVAHGNGRIELALALSPCAAPSYGASSHAVSSHDGDHPLTGARPYAVLRVEVSDDSPLPARRGSRREDEEHGRGLLLVEALSDRWGQQARGEGKHVWCEFALPGPPPRRARRAGPCGTGTGTDTRTGIAESHNTPTRRVRS
ncbi:ATP-binding protein [Streptomyces sp. NPDC047108]|uniref:ATP-binding protein n=1 Tax=Streptomyces sp. NPDC047108 TaxID=3155025 RepID=UPI0033C50734